MSVAAVAFSLACVIPLSVCLQVCACIRTAMDAAQDAAAARDKLLDQQAESEAELRSLRGKTTRQAAAVAAAADAEERVTAAEAKCKAARADTSSWQSQVWQTWQSSSMCPVSYSVYGMLLREHWNWILRGVFQHQSANFRQGSVFITHYITGLEAQSN